jgi:hypothetical protein
VTNSETTQVSSSDSNDILSTDVTKCSSKNSKRIWDLIEI